MKLTRPYRIPQAVLRLLAAPECPVGEEFRVELRSTGHRVEVQKWYDPNSLDAPFGQLDRGQPTIVVYLTGRIFRTSGLVEFRQALLNLKQYNQPVRRRVERLLAWLERTTVAS